MIRKLQQWNGAGNDFLVDVDNDEALAIWTPELARAVCDRQAGLGADGLLLASLREGRLGMRLFNADGSIAEMSGNGIRCLVAAVHRATRATWSEIDVETDAGLRTVSLKLDGLSGSGSAWMGHVRLDAALPGTLGVANVGNPHIVVSDDASWTVDERTAKAESLSNQLGGANVEFVTIVHPARVAIKVHERGVGWTLACGTGSVATAAVLHALGQTGERIVVENPGGELIVSLGADGATLGGPVEFERDVEWTLA